MSFEYSPLALMDLERIQDDVWAVSGDFDVTDRYVNELMDKVEEKQQFPESGHPVYDGDMFTGYYFVVYKAYLAFYYPRGDGIYIDRVLPTKSDYMRVLRRRPSPYVE